MHRIMHGRQQLHKMAHVLIRRRPTLQLSSPWSRRLRLPGRQHSVPLPLSFTLIFLVLSLCSRGAHSQARISFREVTEAAGLPTWPPLNRYGGGTVADLDGDGHADLVLGSHTSPAFVLFNNGDGTFRQSPFNFIGDFHGFNAYRAAASDRRMSFFVSRGGRRATLPFFPSVFTLAPNGRTVINVTEEQSLGYRDFSRGRGRTVLSVHLKAKNNRRNPDFLFLNAVYPDYTDFPQYVVTMVGGNSNNPRFASVPEFRTLSPGIAKGNNHFATVTDIDNDGQMEVIIMQDLHIFKKGVADFQLRNVTADLLPRRLRKLRAVRAIAELDYDNDGWMDLYIARSTNNDMKWLRSIVRQPRDILLRNVGGRYYRDVTERVGLPSITSGGVTVGDFDNDGRIDIMVTRHSQPDLVFRNSLNSRGLPTFLTVPGHGYVREADVPGDQPTAFDYDRDGRIDVLLSEGDWYENAPGIYRLLRNVSPGRNGYLLVRVKSSPSYGASSLHARVVLCVTADGPCQTRRVGSPGQAVSASYVETVHFGLGSGVRRVASVTVHWVDGQTRTKTAVRPNSFVGFGKL